MDEPFGALDSITRKNLQKWLIDLKQKMNSTILFITHDIDEAILISDRVYVITEKPAVIKGEIKIQLPECGENEVSLCKEYIDLKRSLIKLLEN